MEKLTDGEFDVFYLIKQFYIEHGISPSIRELCERSGKASTSTIHWYLKKLKRKGYIDYQPTKSRTIRILYEEK